MLIFVLLIASLGTTVLLADWGENASIDTEMESWADGLLGKVIELEVTVKGARREIGEEMGITILPLLVPTLTIENSSHQLPVPIPLISMPRPTLLASSHKGWVTTPPDGSTGCVSGERY